MIHLTGLLIELLSLKPDFMLKVSVLRNYLLKPNLCLLVCNYMKSFYVLSFNSTVQIGEYAQ